MFQVTEDTLSTQDLLRAIEHPGAGGLSLFLGAVRNESEGREVALLEYHAYVSMAEKQMSRIALGIAAEIPGVRLAALHRIGKLKVGDLAVICGASAPHREEAFRACRLLIDRIKAEVPIWKREHGPAGPYWVGWEDARCEHGSSSAVGADPHHHHHHREPK